jgi:hypothetical protein
MSPDFALIRDYLEDKMNFSKHKLDAMLGPLEKHFLEKRGKRRQTTLDGFVLKTVSPPKNARVACVVDRWKIKQIDPDSIVIDSKSIRMPKSRGTRGKKRGSRRARGKK